jgi:hypothetical protein
MAHYVVCPQKKIISRIFKISGALIVNIDTKAKCRHLKKFTCQGTLRQVFLRVYRLEKQSVMLVFSTLAVAPLFFR